MAKMDRDQRLKQWLLDTGQLSEEQVAQAVDYALTMDLALDESIVFLQLMSYSELGKVLQQIYNTPYSPLLEKSLTDEMKRIVPLSMAERFTIFPVEYDPTIRCITIATDDPDDQVKREQLSHLLVSSVSPAFTVASRPEISRAIEVHYKGKNYAPELPLELPKEFTIIAPSEGQNAQEKETPAHRTKAIVVEPVLERFRALKTLLRLEGIETLAWAQGPQEIARLSETELADLILINGEAYRTQHVEIDKEKHSEAILPISYYYPRAMLVGGEPSYGAMSEALISLVAFLIKKALKKDPSRLSHTLNLVRYCKLICLRLGLHQVQTDAVVLAAWLSTSTLGSVVAKSINTPYGLSQLLSEGKVERKGLIVQREILSLVREYLKLKQTNPEAVADTDGIRRTIGVRYRKGTRRKVFEAFVQVIRDQGLFEGIDEKKGSVLMVGQGLGADSELVLRLKSEGYQVCARPSAKGVAKDILQSPPDAIICEIQPNDKGSMELCKAIRKNPTTSNTPFFFLATKEAEHLATECLEIGADDFLVSPLDPDLIALKVGRAINSRVRQPPTNGIEGSLAEMNAMDIIQSVATGEKNVKITLESNGIKGVIYIRAGDIIHAHSGAQAGEEALFRLMGLKEGRFQVISCQSFPQRTIHGSTMSLLMEGARLIDEAGGGQGAVD